MPETNTTSTAAQPALEFLHPKDLKIHPALKTSHRWEKDDPRFFALKDSMRDGGTIPALFIDKDNRIVDGRHRYWAALDLQWERLPVVRISEDEVQTIIIKSIVNRRHYTDAQLAYLALPHMEEAFEEARKRQLSGLKNAPSSPVPQGLQKAPKRVEEWAEMIGVSVRLLQQAREIRELFADKEPRSLTDRDGVTATDATFQEFFEPRIFTGENPYGLGAVLTGIKTIIAMEHAARGGRAHTGGKPQGSNKQLELFDEAFDAIAKRWSYWQKADDEWRNEHWKTVRKAAAALPPEQCAEMAKYHAKIGKEFSKVAKAAKNAPKAKPAKSKEATK